MMNTARTLSRSQLRELKAELESERARLERSMALSGAGTSGGPAGSQPGARLPFAADGGFGVALLDQSETRLDAVTQALRRLAAGGYGICASCQQPIPYGRLLAIPETNHCVSCGARA